MKINLQYLIDKGACPEALRTYLVHYPTYMVNVSVFDVMRKATKMYRLDWVEWLFETAHEYFDVVELTNIMWKYVDSEEESLYDYLVYMATGFYPQLSFCNEYYRLSFEKIVEFINELEEKYVYAN